MSREKERELGGEKGREGGEKRGGRETREVRRCVCLKGVL
jgi:hypothetical protein